jgi:hypothetical protein
LTTAILAGALDNKASVPVAVGALGIYALGPAVVHLAHGQPQRAAASAGMRIGFPALGVGIAYALSASCGTRLDDAGEPESDLGCIFTALFLGGVVAVGGTVSAIIIDDAVLGKVARKEVARGPTFGVAPLVSARSKALGLTLVTAF